MKIVAAILALLLTGSVALAQKTKNLGSGTGEGRSRHTAAYKSANGDVVAATLKRNSTTASQLAQIEHQGNRPHSAHTSTKAASPNANAAGLGKNKPMHFSYKAPHAAGKAH